MVLMMFVVIIGSTQENSTGAVNGNSAGQQTNSIKDMYSYSPDVKAALISLFGLFILALISNIVSVRQTRKERDKAKLAADAARKVADRFIYRTRAIKIVADVKDFDSSAVMRYEWDGIQISRSGSTTAYIPGKAIYEAPGCKVEQYP